MFDASKNMSPEERGRYLEEDEVTITVNVHMFPVFIVTTTDSSVGRAEDCSGILISLGRWFESGSVDFFFLFFFFFVFRFFFFFFLFLFLFFFFCCFSFLLVPFYY